MTEHGHLLSERGESLVREVGGEAVITLSNTIVVRNRITVRPHTEDKLEEREAPVARLEVMERFLLVVS